jgi:DNA-binding CsgD family transcriptional regulator/tetratricopeptide (TPR) repeat protein
MPRRGTIDRGSSAGDTSYVATKLSSNQFVGREAQLEELVRASQAAADGRPALVLLGGDSGVGKTRLIGELEKRLAGEGATVLRGEAVEQSQGELPFAPLTSAFRPLVRARDPAFDALGAGSRAELGALLPGLEQTDGRPGERHDPSAQLRLFEALLELLDVIGERQPLVLILEDVHWADRSTRTFVAFLARSLRDERLLVVLSYRTDEVHRRHPLSPLLAELERLEHVRRIGLEPFDRAELTEVLADILDAEPDAALVERLFMRSEGNALYTEELLAAGLDGRGAAPQSLRHAFLLRIERLSPDAQQAARAIAVGRRLDEPMIAAVAGIEPTRLQPALREAVAEQVLVTTEDRLMFRHALLREALYDDLLPGERGDLHLTLARTLESRCVDNDEQEAELAAAIAGHYAAAGDQPAALRATVSAALAARDVHAYGEAADLAERALMLWPRVSDADETIPLGRVDLLELAAAAHSIAGDRSRAETLLDIALDEVDPDSDPRWYARLLYRKARIQWSLNRGLEGASTAERALSMLPSDTVSVERASLMAWLARLRFLRGRYRDAIVEGETALAEAVAVGDRHTEGEILNTLGMAHISIGDVEPGVALLRRSIEIGKQMHDLDNLGYAYSNLADMLGLHAARTREAIEVAQEGLAAIPRRMPRLHDWLMLTVAQLSFEIGDWDTARTHLAPPSMQLDRDTFFRLLLEADVGLGEGDDEFAGTRLDEAEPFVAASTEPQWIGWFGALRGEQLRRGHELLDARAAIDHALDRVELCTDDVMSLARVAAAGLRVEADIAQRARDLRERAGERDAIARAKIQMQRLDAAAQEGGPIEQAWQRTGQAELARARARATPDLWLAAAREWESVERPYQSAVMCWHAAEAEVDAGDRDAAAALAGGALEVAERLGSRWLADEVTGLAHRARLALGPAGAGSSDGSGAVAEAAAQDEEPFGLTPRERQVLALIAEGATNRQIGAALFIAEKTASVHVSRILGKLGVSSRTQAAAVAHRLHLT